MNIKLDATKADTALTRIIKNNLGTKQQLEVANAFTK